MPTFDSYKKFREQKKPRQQKRSIRGRTDRPIGPVLDDLICEIENNLIGEHEIIIVNDGCTDETEREIEELLRGRKFQINSEGKNRKTFSLSANGLKLAVTILLNETNQGLTPAFVLGYKEALKKTPAYVIKLDSDGLHDPSKFPVLLNRITRDKNMKFTWLKEDPKKGYGFRAIRGNVLNEIMPALEKYSICLVKKYPDNPEERRGADRMTNRLINALD